MNIIDQCDATAHCVDTYGSQATDCQASMSEMSVCLCGTERCDALPTSSEGSASSMPIGEANYLLTDAEGSGTLKLAASNKPHPKPGNDVPLGEVKTFNTSSRRVRVYLPAGYAAQQDLALMVFNDGSNYSGGNEQWAMHYAMDVLIARKEMPVTVGVFIDPINGDERKKDYSSPNQKYTDVVLTIIDTVKNRFNVDITDDPGMRGIAGHSAGGSAAFWMVWQNTDLFSRIFSSAGMFNTAFAPYLDWAKKGDRKDKVRIALLTVDSDRGHLHRPLTRALDQGGYNYFYVESTTGEHSFKTVRGEGKRMLRWLWKDWAKRQGDGNDLGGINPVSGAGNVTTLFSGGEFTEGPAWIPDAGVLLFSDLRQNVTYRLTPPNTIDEYLNPNNSANGVGWDPRGYIVLCERDPAGVARGQYGGTVATIVSDYNGNSLNTPNDNVVRSDGTIYFTDLRGLAAYRIDPNGNVDRIGDGYRPNGIALSPDESHLYVTAKTIDNDAFHIWRYDVAGDGSTSNKTRWVTLDKVSDGIAVDDAGNVYATTENGLEVFKPSGDRWGVINLSSRPSNAAFGGADRKTLYVTTIDGKLLSLDMPIPGKP